MATATRKVGSGRSPGINPLVILGITTAVVLCVTVYVNLLVGIDVVYTHLFYIPIILAAIFFHRKAVFLALSLGAFHIAVNYLVDGNVAYDAFLRAIMFLAIAYFIGLIVERKDRICEVLKSSEEKLRRMHETLELRIKERTAELYSANDDLRKEVVVRKKAEEEYHQLASRLMLLMESTDEGIYGIDLEGRCTFLNRSASKKIGYSARELLGKKIHPIIHHHREDGSPLPESDCPNLLTIRTGHGIQVRNDLFIRRDGAFLPVEYSSYPILEEGVIRGAVVVFSDTSERKRYEEELLKSKAQAELYVDIMGHDINNMNQGIMGYLEMASDMSNASDEEKEFIARSIELVKNSSRLIDNVKKLQRINAGDVPAETVDLGQMLSRVAGQYSGTGDRDIVINCPAARGYTVKANSLIKDVFANIVDNAVKHSRGPLTVNIGLDRVRADSRDFYRIAIEDDGPGLPDEMKRKLSREIDSGEIKAERRGLGLYMVRTLVGKLGGRMWIEDRVPGDYAKGSKFVVLLPASND